MGKRLIQDEIVEYTCDCCDHPIGRLARAVSVTELYGVETYDERYFCSAVCFLSDMLRKSPDSYRDYVLRFRGPEMVEVVRLLKERVGEGEE